MKDNYVEIDLFDLCKDILKKWKLIVVCLLIGALLGGLYSFYQARKPKVDDATRLKEITASLTQEEKNDVEDAAKVINSYREMFAKQKDYNENSIYQNLNPYNLKTLKLSYYVDNHYKVSYPIMEESNNLVPIITVYTSDYLEDSFYADFAKENGIDNPVYIRELITTDVKDKDTGVFSIVIYAETDEMLEKLGDFVKAAVKDKQAEVIEQYGEHEISLVSETYFTMVNTLMADSQQLNIERLTTITSDIANEEKAFSGAQLSYLKLLVHETADESVGKAKFISTGAVLGAILAVAYVCIRYFVDGTVKTEREISRYLKVDSLGKLSDGESFLAARINSIMDANGLAKTAIVCGGEKESLDDLVSQIKPEAVLVTDLLTDKNALEVFASCDAAVLIEEIKSTKRKDVINKKQMCDGANVRLLGVILK